MNHFEIELKYKEIVKEQDEITSDLEKYTNQIKALEKLVKENRARMKELVNQKQKIIQFKIPADYY